MSQAEAQLRYQAQLLAAIKDAVIATDERLMTTTSFDSAFITGIAKLDQRLAILLGRQRILTTEEKLSLQPAM